MTRSVLLLSVLLGACVVGEAPKPDGGGGGNANRNVCAPPSATPAQPYSHSTDPIGPRARMGCMDAACHAMGGPTTVFAFAGTVYKETAAVTPAAGVTVRVFKPGNNTALAEAITDTAGNFIIRQGVNGVMFTEFPYDTHVTACGTSIEIRPMVAQIQTADANCNSAGTCHGETGGQGAIYMPD